MTDANQHRSQPEERRGDHRRACLLRGDLVSAGGRAEPVAVMDLTAEGARVAMRRSALLPTSLTLRLSLRDGAVIYDAQLLWRRGLEAGLVLSGRRDEAGLTH